MSADIGVRARMGLAVAVFLLVTVCYGLGWSGFALGIGLVVTGLGAAQAGPSGRWLPLRLVLILAEVALIAAALYWAVPVKAMLFHSPAILLLFAMVAVHTVNVRPLSTWWAGVSALGCWYVAGWIAQHDPATLTKAQVLDGDYDTLIDYLGAVMQPRYLSLDALWLQLCALGGFTVILGVASWRMRSLARAAAGRQAALASLSGHFAGPVAEALLSEGFTRPERMQLAVLDCDMVGFSRIAAQMAPEAVAAALRTYHAFVEGIVFGGGGAVLKYVGDGVIAVFGFAGGTDAAAQALACAERLTARWPEAGSAAFGLETPPRLVAGVDFGEALAGIVGEERTLSLIVTGPAVEGAARLQSARDDGATVRASTAVIRERDRRSP